MISAKPGSWRPLIVSLYGPSCAGKSQTAKAVATLLGEQRASRVQVDAFAVPRPFGMPMAEYRAGGLAWDWPLLAERLALPLGTATSTPDFDFDAFVRRASVGGMPFVVRPVMLLDAIEPYRGADLRVLIDVPDAVRRERIVERDRRWGTRVLDTWDHLQATWEAVRMAAPEPDLIVDATQPIVATAQQIAQEIASRT